jgi:MoxR-like ATPase
VKKYVSWGRGPARVAVPHPRREGTRGDGRARGADLVDVNAMAMPVLGHRVVLNFQAEAEGVTPDKVIAIDKRP